MLSIVWLLLFSVQWILGHYGFTYPLTLTSVHMIFSFAVLLPFALAYEVEVHKNTLQKQWKGIVYIGCFMALNIALNNISLLDISLSLNQIIRSSIPVVTCVLAIYVEGTWPSHNEFVSLVVLAGGVMIAVWQGSVFGSPRGIMFCLYGTVSNAAMMTFSGKLLSEKLDVVRLTFYTAPVALLCLLPFAFFLEYESLVSYITKEGYQSILALLLLSSTNAVCYNAIHSMVIKQTSAVTTTVIGEVKIVALLILSAFILNESKQFTGKMLLGCALAIGGFIAYSHAKLSHSVKGLGLPKYNEDSEDGMLLKNVAASTEK